MERSDLLYKYSDFSVDFKIEKRLVLREITQSFKKYQSFVDNEGDIPVTYYYEFNEWESNFFGIDSIVLKFIDYNKRIIKLPQESLCRFYSYLKKFYSHFLITIEMPSEDNILIQTLNQGGFRLIESRLHYYKNDLENFNGPRSKVRKATLDDIENLKKVAKFMRNQYDRFHSDSCFNSEIADNYLSTYIENSIKGFADLVIVPNDPRFSPDSFLTANYLYQKWNVLEHSISKMVLSAVSAKTNKGWYIKLISEMTYILRDLGAKTIYMNTQPSSIAVLYSWEKLGYHLGRTTHLFSKFVGQN